MNKFKQLASETAIYGLSSIVGKAINFILVPFYTSTAILKVEEYGIVAEDGQRLGLRIAVTNGVRRVDVGLKDGTAVFERRAHRIVRAHRAVRFRLTLL